MALVTRVSSRVRTPHPRNFVANPWRATLKALSSGLWLMAIGLVSVTSVLMGLGWLLAVSTSAPMAGCKVSAGPLTSMIPSSSPVRGSWIGEAVQYHGC